MGFGCNWPQFSTQSNILLSMKAGVLASLVQVPKGTNWLSGYDLTTRPFDWRDLTAPVPASAYFGAKFIQGHFVDAGRDRFETPFGAIAENEYQPRVIVNEEIFSFNPLYQSCEQFRNTKDPSFSNYFVVWDPPVTVVGTPPTSLPGTEHIAPLGSPSVSSGSVSRASVVLIGVPYSVQAPEQVASLPSRTASLDAASKVVSENNVPTSPTMISPPVMTMEPIVLLPPQPGEPSSQYRIAVGSATTILTGAGPAVTVGSRIISVNGGGTVYEQFWTRAPLLQSASSPVINVGPFISSGSALLNSQILSQAPYTSLQRQSSATYSLITISSSETKKNDKDSAEVTFMVTSESIGESTDSVITAPTTTSTGAKNGLLDGVYLMWCSLILVNYITLQYI
jgi:hypothetical protein